MIRMPGVPSFLLALAIASAPAHAGKRYDPGASDTEIRIGQTMAYSGPNSGYGTIGRAQAAYFAKINAEGGVNGRRIKFISLDDGFNPAKTVEQVRRLVEHDQVLLVFSSLGAPTNAAVQKYLNQHEVPQLFVAASEARFADPLRFPWTMGFHQASYTEGKIYAAYIIKHYPSALLSKTRYDDGPSRRCKVRVSVETHPTHTQGGPP